MSRFKNYKLYIFCFVIVLNGTLCEEQNGMHSTTINQWKITQLGF